ncbi:unnamed protein product [Clonostachys byssicola]|uniref:Uncharacterized protein n=1 Tax=Clonostachys byssicola TaxID=160290 RepID=A0A9N9UGC1_9HYPO|nr:unnamed protein product [Clonostachys byssicola]
MTQSQQMTRKRPVNRANFSSPLYSEATIHHDVVYCSGKIGLDPATGQLVGDDVAEQTKAAFNLLESVLHTAGSSLASILKCNIFLSDVSDFAAMNAAYIATVPDPKPARVCVSNVVLGRGAKVEIDCIAALEQIK